MSLSIYLQKNELTYDAFGQMIGVTGTSVYRYLTGERLPKRNILEKIASVTNGQVTADDFYNLTKTPTSKKPTSSKKLTSN